MFNTQFIHGVLRGLAGHQEAILAFAMTLIGTGLLLANFSVLIAAGMPALFYLLYSLRMLHHDRHLERLEEISVRKIENSIGKPARRRNLAAVEKIDVSGSNPDKEG